MLRKHRREVVLDALHHVGARKHAGIHQDVEPQSVIETFEGGGDVDGIDIVIPTFFDDLAAQPDRNIPAFKVDFVSELPIGGPCFGLSEKAVPNGDLFSVADSGAEVGRKVGSLAACLPVIVMPFGEEAKRFLNRVCLAEKWKFAGPIDNPATCVTVVMVVAEMPCLAMLSIVASISC